MSPDSGGGGETAADSGEVTVPPLRAPSDGAEPALSMLNTCPMWLIISEARAGAVGLRGCQTPSGAGGIGKPSQEK